MYIIGDMRPNGVPRLLGIAFLALGVLAGFYLLVVQAWYFFGGAAASDAMYYWTIGRGLLNGLTLYTEIFDTKPPAIYLLSALSLSFSGDGTLGFWINALMTLLLPPLFGMAAWKMTQECSSDMRKLWTLLSLLFGTVLTLFAGAIGEAWQVEWYGAFFGTLYVLLLVACPRISNQLSLALLSACVFFTVGFKEPFAFSLLAVAVILLPDRSARIKNFLVPVAIVVPVACVALLLFGFAGGYFSVYLPTHFGHHLVRSMPLWQRGFLLDLLIGNLAQFSYVFAALMTVLFGAELMRSREEEGYKAIATRACTVLLALYLVILAANLRGYPTANHFAVAVPFYAALFFIFLRCAIASGTDHLSRTAKIIVALTALTLLSLAPQAGLGARAEKLKNNAAQESRNRSVASSIDAILDACDIDRYFFIEEKPYMPHTAHSPLNFFVYMGPESVVYHHAIIIERQLQSFSAARVIIAEGSAYEIKQRPEEKLLSEQVLRYIAGHFALTPWPCADGLPLPEGYSVLFRKDPNDTAPFPYRLKYGE